MPNTFAEAVSQTFSSASLHFVLGREDESGDDFRLDYTNWDQFCNSKMGRDVLLSILYVMPLPASLFTIATHSRLSGDGISYGESCQRSVFPMR